jgi:sugar/nucleoside kinase (ribokinase family)
VLILKDIERKYICKIASYSIYDKYWNSGRMECWNDGFSKDISMFKKGIAIIGSTTKDENITATGGWRKVGGVTAYSGITYRRHGIATTIVSNIAPKDEQLQAALQKEKIKVYSGRTTHTTHFRNEVIKNKRKQKILFRSAPINADSIKEIVQQASCIHLGPLHPQDIDPAAIEKIKFSQLPVFLDIQGYTRRIKGEDITAAVSPRISPVLKISQIIKAKDHELETILSFLDHDISELIRAYNIEECVVTRGAEGGFVQDKDGNVHSYDAKPVDTIADPTGAGDVFLAAYLISRFQKKQNITDACGYAAKLSAEQVSGKYITQDVLSLDPCLSCEARRAKKGTLPALVGPEGEEGNFEP